MILFKDLSEEQKTVVVEKMEKLYIQKYSDSEIAKNISEILGDHFHTSNVRNWRMRNKLIKNNSLNSFEYNKRFRLYKEGTAKDKEDILLKKKYIDEKNRIRFEIYNQGYSDREIAHATNSNLSTIKSWRRDNKLFKHENKLVISGSVTESPTLNHNDNGDFYRFSFSYQGLNKIPVMIEAIVRKPGLFPMVRSIDAKTKIKIADGELYFEMDNQLISPKVLVHDLVVL